MPGAPVPFKRNDIMRLVKGALAGGLAVTRVEADTKTGKIVVFSDPEPPKNPDSNEWDGV